MSVHNTGAAGDGSQLGLGDSVYQRLLKERIIWLGGEVRDENANAICAQLLLLAAEDPDRDIYLYINSPGGSVTAGMAIYDTMQYVKPDVVTVGMGLAASMAQFLLTAGAPGKRYITPHARVLLHQPLGGAGGSATDIRINADLILGMKKELAAITASRTGKTVEQVEADGDRDHWFTAQEALEYGFVDRVIDSPQEIVFLGVQVDDASADDVMAQLLVLESQDPDSLITMYINSPGGSFTALTAIYDTMQYIKPQIQTVCLGQAASAAAVLLAAGSPGKRLALPNARVLIHQPAMEGMQGQASDIQIVADEIDRMRVWLEDTISKHSGKPVEQVRRDIERDKILTAPQAAEYGLIDQVLESRKAL